MAPPHGIRRSTARTRRNLRRREHRVLDRCSNASTLGADRTPGVAARPGRRGRRPPAARRAPHAARARRVGRRPDRLGRGRRPALRRAAPRRAVARRAPADVRLGRRRPRLLCFYGDDDPLPHPALAEARDALSAHYADELGEPFRTAGLCLYRDGHDSVAWHGDRIGRSRDQDTMVAILSVGCAARPRAPPARRRLVDPGARPGTATSSSWAARASAPGTTACPRPPGRWAPASRSSSGRAACAELRRPSAAQPRAPGAATERDAAATAAARAPGRSCRPVAADVREERPVQHVARAERVDHLDRRAPARRRTTRRPPASAPGRGRRAARHPGRAEPEQLLEVRADGRTPPPAPRSRRRRRGRRRAPSRSSRPGFHEPPSAMTGMPRRRAAAATASATGRWWPSTRTAATPSRSRSRAESPGTTHDGSALGVARRHGPLPRRLR